jgi:hypothetical protein
VRQEEHERELGEAADGYLHAQDQLTAARRRLTTAMRAAYADKIQQAKIIRWSKHVWTREYVRQVLGLTRKGGPAD